MKLFYLLVDTMVEKLEMQPNFKDIEIVLNTTNHVASCFCLVVSKMVTLNLQNSHMHTSVSTIALDSALTLTLTLTALARVHISHQIQPSDKQRKIQSRAKLPAFLLMVLPFTVIIPMSSSECESDLLILKCYKYSS